MRLPLIASVLLATCAFAGTDSPALAETSVRAQLVAKATAIISAEINAKVCAIPCQDGARFHAGDVLLRFDDSLQRAQLERAEAVLAACERTHAANTRLRDLNSIGQVELELSAAEVAKAKAELAYAKSMLSKCTIRAPYDGMVAEQRIHEHEYAQAGQALLEVVGTDKPEIQFIAPSKWLAWLRPGLDLTVIIEESGASFPARITRLGARVDPVSQSVKVAADFTETTVPVIAGMSGTVQVVPPQSSKK